tara:strand:- start:113 stop:895 length:783 start_codon:yes stop_codon:yes gene_type:complete
MSENFKVDSTLWKARSKKLVKQLKLDEPKFVREQAGLLAQLMAKVAPPFTTFPKLSGKATYTTGGAQGQGVKSVKSGFFSSVKKVGAIGAWKDKRIRKAIRAGNANYIEDRLRHMKRSNKKNLQVEIYSDSERNRKRDNRGRVSKDTRPFVGLQNKDVNAGLKRAVGNVGMAKATLALAALRLGRPKAPKWISRHFGKVRSPVKAQKNPARASFKVSAAGLDVVVRNLRKIERFRMRAMVKRLESLVKQDAKKAGFKVKR